MSQLLLDVLERADAEENVVEGERKEGDQVNLERAMGAHVRFGGHFVQVSKCFVLDSDWTNCYARRHT